MVAYKTRILLLRSAIYLFILLLFCCLFLLLFFLDESFILIDIVNLRWLSFYSKKGKMDNKNRICSSPYNRGLMSFSRSFSYA